MSNPKLSLPSSGKERFIVIALIVVGLLLVIFFGLRAVRAYVRLQQSGLEQGVTNVEAIRGWMTVPYIAKAYGVPEAYIFEQLDIPQAGNQEKSLGELNWEYGEERAEIPLAVQGIVKVYLAEHPPTPDTNHD